MGYVRGRWDKIWEHLRRCEKRSEPWERYWSILEARKARQLTDLHTLAHCSILIPPTIQRALQAFLRYHTRRAPFADYRKSWDYAEDPEIFWQLHFDDHIPLSTLAHRLFPTLANSVPCKRNFSSMKVLHSKLRSRLTVERINKTPLHLD